MKPTLCYAQSGGATAVLNATAAAVIETARTSKKIGRVLAAENGILGALEESLMDVSAESASAIRALNHTPGAAFGSCRHQLPDAKIDSRPHRRLLEVFRAHDVRWFLYNGGNDSQDTSLKISRFAKSSGEPLICVGIPKTIDNDLPATDACPGFGSVAKYVAVSIAEAALDVRSMSRTSTKVFVLEVMGRYAGWIAAAAGLADSPGGATILLLPEIPFDPPKFLARVKAAVTKHGFCAVAVAEGLKNQKGEFVAEQGGKDSFSHVQLGGVAPKIAALIKSELGYKFHWGVADYLQRAARHIASETDLRQAQALGKAAVKFALADDGGSMPIIERISDSPYRWKIGRARLAQAAGKVRKMPRRFISGDGFFISEAGRRYLSPLIAGEAYSPFRNGLPLSANLRRIFVPRKLPPY